MTRYSVWAGSARLTQPDKDGMFDDSKVRVIPSDLRWSTAKPVAVNECRLLFGLGSGCKTEGPSWDRRLASAGDLKVEMKKIFVLVMDEWFGDRALRECILLPTGGKAASLEQMKASWLADGSVENGEKMFNVLYGSFELGLDAVFDKLEEDAMKRCNLKYKGTEDSGPARRWLQERMKKVSDAWLSWCADCG